MQGTTEDYLVPLLRDGGWPWILTWQALAQVASDITNLLTSSRAETPHRHTVVNVDLSTGFAS